MLIVVKLNADFHYDMSLRCHDADYHNSEYHYANCHNADYHYANGR